jgi:uncharacterized membrane protein
MAMPTFTPESLLKWAGVVLVALAAVFFVSTAISRGWIGPELQLAGATVIGMALIAGGFYLAERRAWSLALTLGGTVVLPVCAAAANAALDLIAEDPALATLAVVTVALGWVAIRLSMEPVTVVAGAAAVLLPFWIVEDVELPVATIGGWMAVLVVVATAVGWRWDWTLARLATVGLAGLALLGVAAEESGVLGGSDQTIALVVTAVVAVTAWIGPAYVPLTGRDTDDWSAALDHRSVLPIPLWTWAMVGAVVSFEDTDRFAWVGFVLAGVFAAAAALAWSWSPTARQRGSRYLPDSLVAAHLAGAGVLVAVAFATLTDSPVLLVGLAVQAAATAMVAWLLRDLVMGLLAAILATIASFWAGVSTLEGWIELLTWGQHLANLTVVVLIVVAAVWVWWRPVEEAQVPVTVVAWATVLGWLPSVLAHSTQGQAALSLIWAVAAAGALLHGVLTGVPLTRYLGLVTLGVTLVKLLTVDLAAVDTLWRVGLFLVVGAGLLRLGYVLPRLSADDDASYVERP